MWSEIEKDQMKQWLRNWRAFNEMEEKLRRDQMCKDIRKGLSYSLTGKELVGPLQVEKREDYSTDCLILLLGCGLETLRTG